LAVLDLIAAGPLTLVRSWAANAAQATGLITLTGQVTASGAGTFVLASGDDIHNSYGASVFNLTGERNKLADCSMCLAPKMNTRISNEELGLKVL